MIMDTAGPFPILLLAKMEQLYVVAGVNPASLKVPACVYGCMGMELGVQERE